MPHVIFLGVTKTINVSTHVAWRHTAHLQQGESFYIILMAHCPDEYEIQLSLCSLVL